MHSQYASHILIVDDDIVQRKLIAEFLGKHGYACQQAADAEQALAMLNKNTFYMVIMDVRMPKMSGLEAQRAIRASFPLLPVLLITAYADIRDAVGAIKDGALDYLVKPIELKELLTAVEDTLGTKDILQTEPLPQIPKEIVAESPAMLSLLAELAIVAPSTVPILITGESGTGKEVLADIIHQWSTRSQQSFIKINCAAIPVELLENELFGHQKGAFTGASQNLEGKFAIADKGTLFLDEIAEMAPSLQAKLLRVLQDGSFQPLGSAKTVKVNVRFIAATNRNIEKEVASGRFREDLFYRLNVIHLFIPPLRERRADILALARRFANKFAGKIRIAAAVENALELYDWPGNIRQLRNVVERACLLARGGIILPEHLPAQIGPKILVTHTPTSSIIEDVERNTIIDVLKETNGNRTQAAKRLGISRRNLLYKLQKYKDQGFAI